MSDAAFRNIRPFGGAAVDVTVAAGLVSAVRPHDPAVPSPAGAIDGGGRIALPTMVDAHIHPDKTAWGEPWVSRKAASGIAELARADAELFHTIKTPVSVRAQRLLSHAATQGTRAVRAHADVSPDFGLTCVEGVAAAREALRGVVDVQIVAFPQHGVRVAPGTAELLEEAARSGVIDFVGGIDPEVFDGDLDGQLDLVFGLADRHGVGVDLHLHDRGKPGLDVFEGVLARTKALSLQGKVTVSHSFALVDLTGADLDRWGADLAAAGIGLTTVAPAGRTIAVQRLREHGVRIGLGSDGVRDSWSPFGNADMLHRAHLLARATSSRRDEDLTAAFTAASDLGAELVGLPKADFQVGAPADFLLVEGECVPQIVVDVPNRDLVVRAGKVVAENGKLTIG